MSMLTLALSNSETHNTYTRSARRFIEVANHIPVLIEGHHEAAVHRRFGILPKDDAQERYDVRMS